ncbi:MAG: hypothetical protein ACR2PX_06210 [Endozoicomonas sp.]|uniref:hypothetical protein n=1 Tax=Endozoicomonas sp. TaxID=1892382 RepID=UPI003D9BF880
MLDFTGSDKKAQDIMIHYANELKNELALKLAKGDLSISRKDQAEDISLFFWKMFDKSAEDKEKKIIILGESDLQFWMERLMNIISGHLANNGFEQEWEKISDHV